MDLEPEIFKKLELPAQDAIILRLQGYQYKEIANKLNERYPRAEKRHTVELMTHWFSGYGLCREAYEQYESWVANTRLKALAKQYAESDENILRITTNAMRIFGAKMNQIGKELGKPEPDVDKLRVSADDFKRMFEIQRTVLEQSLGKVVVEHANALLDEEGDLLVSPETVAELEKVHGNNNADKEAEPK